MQIARRPSRSDATPRRRRGLRAALLVFACSCAFVVQSPGWAQTSYMSLSRALSSGTPQIDRWHWQTHDVAYTNGHYYSVKPPGLAFATLPLYRALDAAGAQRLAHEARVRAESDGGAPWAARTLPIAQYGYSRERAIAARAAIADDAPMTWVLGLLGVLAPAIALLVLVARGADRIARGTGTAVALTLGAGTLMLPFSTLYFSHVLSALLSFAAFALVWRERTRAREAGDGAAELRPTVLAVAGLLAGLAVVCEYPLAITALIVGLYALVARVPGKARRALSYGGGLAAGVAPLLAYQWWAFGSPLHTTYTNAVKTTGRSGHDELGLNDDGFFGITLPRPGAALELLFSGRGLLILAPVLVLAIAGIVALRRERGGRHRAEAMVVIAIALSYLLYNAGYWLPMGGGSPGPRFLFPVLPFLALGLAISWRRWPAVTLALTAISATTMIAATISYPMIGVNDPGAWVERMQAGIFQHTVLDLAGAAHGLASIAPFAIAIAAAVAVAVGTLGRAHLARGVRWVPAAVAGWALAATLLSRPLQLPSDGALTLYGAAALVALLAVAVVAPAAHPAAAPSTQDEEHHAATPRALEVQAAQRPF
ncbi:MAG TPA: hypothetical protein VNT54_12185 [Solirubrobacteraceae bacterium]|nr:hypothetical protein [Solirubrobacteraceae bacterium]